MVRKYYKYIYSNIDLSMFGGNILLGGDSLAITNYGVCYQTNYPWHVFDGATNTAWISTIGIPTYLIWSFPHPTYLGYTGNKITVTNYTANFLRAGTLDYSDDCVNWTKHTDWTFSGGSGASFDIDTTNIGYHKYYRFYISSASANTNVGIRNITSSGNRMRISCKDNELLWNVQSSALFNISSWEGIICTDTMLLAINSSGYIASSVDGTTWSPRQVSNLGSNNWVAIAQGNDKFVALGRNGYVSVSDNGLDWSVASEISTLTQRSWYILFYSTSESKFIAIDNYGYISWSSDGLDWSTPVRDSGLSTAGNVWRDVAYGNGTYVAVDQYGYVSRSADGLTWINAERPLYQYGVWSCITYVNDRFVAIGGTGTGSDSVSYTSTSVDGVTWSPSVTYTLENSANINNFSCVTADIINVPQKAVALSLGGWVASSYIVNSDNYDYYEDVPEYNTTFTSDTYKTMLTMEGNYYKYSETPFNTPILTANNSLGGRSFAVEASAQNSATYAAWKAFDGLFAASNAWVTPNNVKSGWITFYNPEKLYVTNISITNRTNTTASAIGAMISGTVYASNDNVYWEELITFTNNVTGSNLSWDIDLSGYTGDYSYYKIEGETSSSCTYLAIGEINLTAKVRTPEISTSQDWDFYESYNTYRPAEF